MKNINLRVIISGIISLIICYFVYLFFISIQYSHHIEMKNYKRYLWLFNENVKKDIDTIFYVGCIGERDILCKYSYSNLNVFIWELKDLGLAKLNEIHINQNMNLHSLKFRLKEVLNLKNTPEINIRYGFTFKNSLNVNIDGYSEIKNNFEAINYKGFYGTLNKVTFSDEKGKQLVIFDYPRGKQPTMFIFYKSVDSFYVLIIDSDKPFDENIINIFNLK